MRQLQPGLVERFVMLMELTQAQLDERPDQYDDSSHAQSVEPICLIKGWRDRESHGRAGFIPDPVIVGTDHLEGEGARPEIRIKSLATPTRILPITIQTREPVTEAHVLRHHETPSRVFELHV